MYKTKAVRWLRKGKVGRVIGACSGSIRNTLTRSNDFLMFLVANPLYMYIFRCIYTEHQSPRERENFV